MKCIIIDTETTGLFDFSKPADAPGQPRLANLGMIVFDDVTQVPTATWNLYVKPDGWKMMPEAQRIHGLTDEYLEQMGCPVAHVLRTYTEYVDDGYPVVGFNAQYDTKVMRGELRRAGMDDRFEKTPTICVMRALTGVCKIPRAKGRGYKFPKLEEACRHFHIEQEQAHSALDDARVTARLLGWLIKLGIMPAPAVHYAKTGTKGE